jgi:adenine-specific DNA-methyltransferase
MIKYLGSKRTLLPLILSVVREQSCVRTVVDLFSGTSRVGHALKGAGYRVLANDHNAYAATLARCYVQADAETWAGPAQQLIDEFNSLPGAPGYCTATFAEQSRFFMPKNAARMDAIREAIARKGLEPELEALVLVSLMEAADRVDSTTGVQMAYLKQWAARAHNDLHLRLPDLLPCSPHGRGEAHQLDALDAAGRLEADVAYLDPPYNQHSYLGNYHVWESLVRWDKPEVYGVACKRVDCRQRQSIFNSRPRFADALRAVLHAVRARVLIVSFSNEGYITRDAMEAMLGELMDGHAVVTTIAQDYKRYVGAQIGIYNPQGAKVGAVSHVRNTEYLYVVTDERVAQAPAGLGDGQLALLG